MPGDSNASTAKNTKKNKKPAKKAPRFSLAIMAACISLMSLGVSTYQMYLARKAHYASVWPNLLMFWTTKVEDDIFHHSVRFWNQGVGPAIVEAVEVEYNQKVYSDFYEALKQFYKDMGKAELAEGSMTTSTLYPGFSFVPGQEWTWVAVDGEGGRLFQENSNKFKIKVAFRSIYGERWVTSLNHETNMVPQPL